MPVITSTYRPPLVFYSGHVSTIYAGLFRRVRELRYMRQRLELPDGDFLDLDWSTAQHPNGRVVVLLHGLEGDARRPYMAGSASILNAYGYDVCSLNFRGCSGETNRLYRSYHSGATEDLEAVINHICHDRNYRQVYIKGFSLGGNICLKYLGQSHSIPEQVKAAVAVSVPCDLHSSLKELLKPVNTLYARRFRKHLIQKLRLKQKLFPGQISDEEIRKIRTLKDFDDIYTSKAHGFRDALDYYAKCSSRQFLGGIRIPVLIINARNDSFLGGECYPIAEAGSNRCLYLEMPRYGGHVGFFGMKNQYYTEKRTIKFFEEST